ncbi:MAG TPA: ATP phosphoribosyltransferase regulatory subunit, partial [Geobacter anodireducens]|nr:ATP phosphoribosyltransferase regulatory subunit [Geobacter anodireducens]
LPEAEKEEGAPLPRLFGGREVLDEAGRVATNDTSRRALDNISQVLDLLDIHGVSDHLTIDLGEVRGLDYHTGLTFEGFVTGMGEAVCSGGRYDTLTARYGFPAPATGFTFNVLALLSALEKRPDVEASKTRDILIFNQQDDRREALEIAQQLRRRGYTTARDIIRRNLDDSLDYARRMNILRMMVVGGDQCGPDEVYLVRVADGQGQRIKKAEVFSERFSLDAGPDKES